MTPKDPPRLDIEVLELPAGATEADWHDAVTALIEMDAYRALFPEQVAAEDAATEDGSPPSGHAAVLSADSPRRWAALTARHAVATSIPGSSPLRGQDHCMAQRRIPGPTNGDSAMRSLKTYVPIEKWSNVTDRAEKAGLTVSKYLTALIDRDVLDANGRPVWVTPPIAGVDPLPGLESNVA